MNAQQVTDGKYNYVVIPISSNHSYTQKSVYHVLTDNPKWCGSHLPQIVGYPVNLDNVGLHDLNCQRHPGDLTYALKPYYKVEGKEDGKYIGREDLNSPSFPVDLDFYYEFTYVRPYDD